MFLGTVFKMNDNMLASQVMLSYFINYENKDYLDLLLPFVKVSLPDSVGDVILLTDMQYCLESRFGIDLPLNVVEKLLKRLVGEYVKEGKYYTLDKLYDSTEFERHFTIIEYSVDRTISGIYDFLKNDKLLLNITKDRVKEMLVNFLDIYDFYMLNDSMALNELTIFDPAKDNFYIASYFLRDYIYAKYNHPTSSNFNCMVEIAKGSLAAKTIYYSINFKNENNELKQLDDIKFILDTGLLIDAAGLSSEESQKTFAELSNLIISNGGKLVTFDYFIKEMRDLIQEFIDQPEVRSFSTLTKLQDPDYVIGDYECAFRLCSSYVEDKGIEILRDSASKFDMESNHYMGVINYIKEIRAGCVPENLFECKAIFITKEKTTCQIYNEYEQESKLPFLAMTNIDLAAILWFATFNKDSKLPRLLMLNNAYAALDFNLQAYSAIKQKSKLLTAKSSFNFKEAMDICTRKILNENKSIKENTKENFSKDLKSLCSEDSDSNSEIHEINISLKTFNKRISMAADDLRFKTKCLNDVINEIKSDELRTLRNRVYTNATKRADSAKFCVENVLNTLSIISFIILGWIAITAFAETTNFENDSLLISLYIVFFVSYLSAAILCRDIIKDISAPLVRKCSEFAWDWTYSIYVKKYRWLYKDL